MSVIGSLFKALKGLSSGLSVTEKKDGQMLFTTDTGKLYFDHGEEGSEISRTLVNPNPDWNSNSGNSQILNKPVFVNSVTVTGGKLVVARSDDGNNDPASYSLNLTESSTVSNGMFIKAGIICWFYMADYTIQSLAAGASVKLADIPSNFRPTVKTSKAALISSPQLSDSLVIEFDPVGNAVNLKNISIDNASNVSLLATSYEFISDLREAESETESEESGN